MTLDELIEQLTEMRDRQNGDVEVRIAYQPSWPLAGYVANVAYVDGDPDDRCETHSPNIWCEECEPEDEDKKAHVWIATSGTVNHDESPYAPRAAWGSDW